MSITRTTVGFTQLLEEAHDSPEAVSANLSLAGIDPATIAILLDHSGKREPHAPSSERVGEWSRRLVERQGEDSHTFGPIAMSKHLESLDTIGSGDSLWKQAHAKLRDWWNGVEFRPDPTRETKTVPISPTLYAISVSGNAPPGTEVTCDWESVRTLTGEVDLKFGIVGYTLTCTAKMSDTRSIKAGPGETVRIYTEGTTELDPTRLYAQGHRTEMVGYAPRDLRLDRPLLIATEPLAVPPAAAPGSEGIRMLRLTDTPDPTPPTWTDEIECNRKLSITVPLSSDTKDNLCLTAQIDTDWSAKHTFALPRGHGQLVLYPLARVPGTILTPET